nr:MAG TPA: hypothetical protein [Caudoviricetes sp.]
MYHLHVFIIHLIPYNDKYQNIRLYLNKLVYLKLSLIFFNLRYTVFFLPYIGYNKYMNL